MASLSKLFALLAAASLAAAQSYEGRKMTYNTRGPYAIPADDWTSYFSDVDYSGVYPISAPDMSQPYPGSAVDGWSVSVAVQGVVPLDKASENQSPRVDSDDFASGLRMTLNPPKKLLNGSDDENEGNWDFHDSWRICYWQLNVIPDGPLSRKLEAADDDGSCGALWSGDCLRRIKNETSRGWGKTAGDCNLEIPNDCVPQGGNGLSYEGMSISPEDGKAWRAGHAGVGDIQGVQVLGYGTDPREKADDPASLEKARKFVVPSIIVFGPKDDAEAVENEPVVNIVCPRAKEKGDVGGENGGPGREGASGARAVRVGKGILLFNLLIWFAFSSA